MQLTITNLTSSPVYIRELYASVPSATPLVLSRTAPEIQAMSGLFAAVAAGSVSMAVSEDTNENTSNALQVVEAAIPMAPPNYTTGGRPASTTFPVGSMIWNTTTSLPNFATSGGWVLADGTAA